MIPLSTQVSLAAFGVIPIVVASVVFNWLQCCKCSIAAAANIIGMIQSFVDVLHEIVQQDMNTPFQRIVGTQTLIRPVPIFDSG